MEVSELLLTEPDLGELRDAFHDATEDQREGFFELMDGIQLQIRQLVAELRRVDQPEPKLRLVVIGRIADVPFEQPQWSYCGGRGVDAYRHCRLVSAPSNAMRVLETSEFLVRESHNERVSPSETLVEIHGNLPELEGVLSALGFQVEVFDHPLEWYQERLEKLQSAQSSIKEGN